jgi:hypothetical protein
MEQTLAIGDWAIITIGRFSKEYTVIGVEARGIIIGDISSPSLLIQGKDNKWQVYGLSEPHSVSFSPPIQGIPVVNDALRTIMMELDYKSLKAFCETDRAAAALCADENFWAQKIEKDYPGALKFKPEDLTFRKQYKHLSYGDRNIYSPLEKGYIHVLDYLQSRGKWEGFVDYEYVIESGAPVSSFIWMLTHEPKVFPGSYDANIAAKFNRLDLLEWMAHLDPPILPDGIDANEILSNATDTTLKWLLDNMIYPSSLVSTALYNNNADFLKKVKIWAPSLRPSRTIIHNVMSNIDYDTLILLKSLDPDFHLTSYQYSQLMGRDDPRIRDWANKEYRQYEKLIPKISK